MTTSPSSTDSDLAFDPKWGIESPSTTMFDFNYTGGREQLLRLYDKGTRRQWIGSDRLDWDTDVDLTNPVGMPDEIMPIFGTPWWDDMSEDAHAASCADTSRRGASASSCTASRAR